MYRKSVEYLQHWFFRKTRKPLIIRGARQVGKTTAVVLAAQNLGVDLITINLDEPEIWDNLDFSNPKDTFEFIALSLGRKTLVPEKTLFFFDEAQERPEVIPFLRYCFEKTPEFRVVLTGSLLEFVLHAPDFSFPVGRVEFLFMGPMTFDEFLRGIDKEVLAEKLGTYTFANSPTRGEHALLNKHLNQFAAIGGMPEAVKTFRDTASFLEVSRIKESILETYFSDFGKYNHRANTEILRQVFQKIPLMIAQKTIYSKLGSARGDANKKALEALELAKVITRCYHSSGNGPPLKAEIKHAHFKTFFLDIGLVFSELGIHHHASMGDLNDIARGVIAEQFIGQHLLEDRHLFEKPSLYYWNRQKKGATSEVDFLATFENTIIPIEVKSGTVGSMKSLQIFMNQKRTKHALRFLNNLPMRQEAMVGEFTYELVSLPHYLVEHWRRFLG